MPKAHPTKLSGCLLPSACAGRASPQRQAGTAWRRTLGRRRPGVRNPGSRKNGLPVRTPWDVELLHGATVPSINPANAHSLWFPQKLFTEMQPIEKMDPSTPDAHPPAPQRVAPPPSLPLVSRRLPECRHLLEASLDFAPRRRGEPPQANPKGAPPTSAANDLPMEWQIRPRRASIWICHKICQNRAFHVFALLRVASGYIQPENGVRRI